MIGRCLQTLFIILICIFYFLEKSECADLFSTQTFALEGKTLTVIPADLDGKGSAEIIVVSKTGIYPNEKRWISIFAADNSAIYSPNPRQRWEVGSEATMIEVGDVASSTGMEIFFLTAHGIRYYSQEEDGTFSTVPQALLSLPTATVFPSVGQLPRLKLLKDWKHSGRQMLLLPQLNALVFFGYDGFGAWKETDKITTVPRTFLYGDQEDDGVLREFSLRADYRLPRIFVEDFNGDNRADLILTEQEIISVYLQHSGNHFAVDPDIVVVLPVRPTAQKNDANLSFIAIPADVNGDGFADVILALTKDTGRFLERKIEIYIFLNQKIPGAPFLTKPEQKITVYGVTPGVNIKDINQDGRQDLLFSYIQLGFWNIVKNLVSKRVDVNTSVYLMQNENRYPTQPDFQQKTSYQLDLTHGIQFHGIWPSLVGDFNGDGRTDLLIARDGQITIYPTNLDRELFSKSYRQSEVLTCPFMHIFDLNQDGVDDLLFYEKKTDAKISIMLNAGALQDKSAS